MTCAVSSYELLNHCRADLLNWAFRCVCVYVCAIVIRVGKLHAIMLLLLLLLSLLPLLLLLLLLLLSLLLLLALRLLLVVLRQSAPKEIKRAPEEIKNDARRNWKYGWTIAAVVLDVFGMVQ